MSGGGPGGRERLVRVEADRDRCVGSGQCALTAPDVFDQDDEEALVVVLEPHPAAGPDVVAAARGCPVGAILLHDDGPQVSGP